MVNKKEICPECKRKLRTKCFVFNRLRKTRMCNQCNRRIGNNKFYVPFKTKSDRMGKYNINELEKKRLWQKYVAQGYSHQMAWRKVYASINGLRGMRKGARIQRKKEYVDKMEVNKQRKQMKKQFVEGLR